MWEPMGHEAQVLALQPMTFGPSLGGGFLGPVELGTKGEGRRVRLFLSGASTFSERGSTKVFLLVHSYSYTRP